MRLPQLVEKVLDHMHPLAEERGIELRLEMPAFLPAIWADETILRRVLINLFDNALKFTPAGGQVWGELVEEKYDDSNGSLKADAGIRVIITDTGPGIPIEARDYIFDRYTRINTGGAQVRGTGLGLTFCKLVIEAHGGRIWVEDGITGGSRFVFTLPGIPIF